MLRRSDVIDLNVIELAGGQRLGRVADVVIDPVSRELRGLLIRTRSGMRFVNHHDIHSFGQDAVTLKASDTSPRPRSRDGGRWLNSVLGKPVLTERGDDMGTIDDVCFDERSGAVLGFQVSGGLIQDLTEGKELLPMQSELTYGRDAVILHDVDGT